MAIAIAIRAKMMMKPRVETGCGDDGLIVSEPSSLGALSVYVLFAIVCETGCKRTQIMLLELANLILNRDPDHRQSWSSFDYYDYYSETWFEH